jgi:predicted ATPase
MTISTEQGLLFWLARGIFERGWALAEQGQKEEGIAQIRQGLGAFWATGTNVWRSCHLGLLAEVYGRVGHIEEGLTAVAEALDWAQRTGGRYYEAELYRLKGELTLLKESKVQSLKSKVAAPRPLSPDLQGEAESCFLKAIEIAQKQQAKSLELRAVMSLVRLCQQQAAQSELCITDDALRTSLAEAHRMLSEVYNWFTEGFDTKDLQDAKGLLEGLST